METNNFENSTLLETIIETAPALKPFIDIIQSIIELPENSLNAISIESIESMMRGAMTPALRKQSIDQIIENYKNNDVPKNVVKSELDNIKDGFKELISELGLSDIKETLLYNMFSVFFEIFDEVKNRYMNYDIELPISLEGNAIAPTYAHDTDAAADLYALEDTYVKAHTFGNKIRTGVRIALPQGWVGYILPRSSTGAKTPLRLSNSIGCIDADYRGELGVLYDNTSDLDYKITAGDRIAQLIVMPCYHFKANVVDILPATERGEGGFGSTGK